MTQPRLTAAALAGLSPVPDRVEICEPIPSRVGIIHLGIGAFHRAHQAVYTQDAMALSGQDGWGILGVSQRSGRVTAQLRAQDCRYGVLTLGRAQTTLREVAAVHQAAFVGEDTAEILQAFASPHVHIVSMTVTEKAYYKAASGAVDTSAPAIQADLAAVSRFAAGQPAEPAASTVGLLVQGLVARYRAGGAPFTVLCCDNIVSNGSSVRALVRSFIHELPDAAASFVSWVETHVTFPCTMVDRIVPATTEAHRQLAAGMVGLRDEALVVAEPFSQWVIEDSFAGPRPPWELAGAQLTSTVEPYEDAKLRMLNGSHSLLAYLGCLYGYVLLADAVGDPALERAMRDLVDQDVIPTLSAPDGMDLGVYRDQLIERFSNPNTGHTCIQIAMDGSQKLPIRVLGTVRDRLAAGAVPYAAAKAIAAWELFIALGRSRDGRELPLNDPLAERLRDVAAGPLATLAGRMMALTEVFGTDLPGNSALVGAIQGHIDKLAADLGTRA